MKMFRVSPLILVITSLVMGSCACNNASSLSAPLDKIIPQVMPIFSLSLAEGGHADSLYTDEPISILLKDPEPPKTASKTTYKVASIEIEGGVLSSNENEQETIQKGANIILQDGTCPLVFSSTGKAGKAFVKMVLENEKEEKSKEIKLEFALRKLNPRFFANLEFATGVCSSNLYTNNSIPLVLKVTNDFQEEAASKYKISKIRFKKGVLKKSRNSIIIEGTEISLNENNELPISFMPLGGAGAASVDMVLDYNGRLSEEISLNFDLLLYTKIDLTTPQEINTNEEDIITLKIVSTNPLEDYTIKSITPAHGKVEILQKNGEGLSVGDTFKKGDHTFSYKIFSFQDKHQLSAASTIYEGKNHIIKVKTKSSLEIVLSDSKGNLHTAKQEYTIFDVNFEVAFHKIYLNSNEVKFEEWEETSQGGFSSFSVSQSLYAEGWMKFEIDIKEYGCLTSEFGSKHLKVAAFTSSDGSPVFVSFFPIKWKSQEDNNAVGRSFPDYGKTIENSIFYETNRQALYLKLGKLALGDHIPPTIITLAIEGPRGVMRTLEIPIGPYEKDQMVGEIISGLDDELSQMYRTVRDVKKGNPGWESNYKPNNYDDAIKAGEEAKELMKKVEFFYNQVKGNQHFQNIISPLTQQRIASMLETMGYLRDALDRNNELYNLNY